MLSHSNKNSNNLVAFVYPSASEELNPFKHNKISVSFKNNFTLVPDILFGNFDKEYTPGLLADLKPSELKTLLVMLRFTLGYKRTWFKMSHSKLLEFTDLGSNKLLESLKNLENRKLIKRFYIQGEINRYELVIENSYLWPDLPDKEKRIIGSKKGWIAIPHDFIGSWQKTLNYNKKVNIPLIGSMHKVSPSELKMILIILRFSLGYKRLWCKFSKEDIRKLTGISLRSYYTCIQSNNIQKKKDKYALQFNLIKENNDSLYQIKAKKLLFWGLSSIEICAKSNGG